MPKKIAYPFDWQHTSDDLSALLGGKGANLHHMTVELGLPVPEGFTIPTGQCLSHYGKNKPSAALAENLREQISEMEDTTGRTFGGSHPLLVSVRSGAPVSMPGMMETILNLGLNDFTVEELAEETDERFAYESYLRFLKMFGTIVHEHPASWYDDRINAAKRFAASDDLDVDTLKVLAKHFASKGPDVPSDPSDQLDAAVMAVFRSWTSEKAAVYREVEGIDAGLGTAVNVQRMVFGNLNDRSATGVAFTRNPNTGDNEFFGDFLINAQGEDVVDGSHVTQPLSDLEQFDADIAAELYSIMSRLEKHYRDMCDIEFTIENGKLFMLQTRVGKRNPDAAIKMAFDMMDEGLIDKPTAQQRAKEATARPAETSDDTNFDGFEQGTGIPASPGIAIGKAYFTADKAKKAADRGEDVVLITHETSPDDVKGMAVAKGVLTMVGGLVSHAAVVARGWGKPCVVGFSNSHAATVNSDHMRLVEGDVTVKEGHLVKIDGTTGQFWTSK